MYLIFTHFIQCILSVTPSQHHQGKKATKATNLPAKLGKLVALVKSWRTNLIYTTPLQNQQNHDCKIKNKTKIKASKTKIKTKIKTCKIKIIKNDLKWSRNQDRDLETTSLLILDKHAPLKTVTVTSGNKNPLFTLNLLYERR